MARRHSRIVAYMHISRQEDLESSMAAWPGTHAMAAALVRRQVDEHSWPPLTGLAGMPAARAGSVL